MPALRPYREHLASSDDLVTTYEATRAGFVALALEKNKRATPFVAEARALRSAASQAKKPADLLSIQCIQRALLTAAGVSDKADKHLELQDKLGAVKELFKNHLEPAGEGFVEELVYRFLLTRGDTLGGSMRDLGGLLAQKRLTRGIVAGLALGGTGYRWRCSDKRTWAEGHKNDAEIENHATGLSWHVGSEGRTLVYNLKVPLVDKNVDLCLFRCGPDQVRTPRIAKAIYAAPGSYIALGELKGGIDPAGADEHWKTARSALDRIKEAFEDAGQHPHRFFVGAAIEVEMAKEIWKALEQGTLTNAANLTDEDQLASIVRWLCSL
jgi:hypothetical protein